MSVYSTLIQAFVGLFLVSLLFTSRGPPLVALAQENADQGEVENVAFCSTVEDLQDAVNVRKVPHIVITSHLDMAGARPVSPDSLAVLSLTSATKTIQGICTSPPPNAEDLQEALPNAQQPCVISVLHSWLQAEPSNTSNTNNDDIIIQVAILDLFVRSVRDGRDGRSPCMLDMRAAAPGSLVWMYAVGFQGDAIQGRGVCSPAASIAAQDCYISGFSAPSGAAVFMDSEINLASDEIATLQLESCMIRGNAATTNPEFGAAIFTRGVPLLLNATTLTGNGPREIAARGSEVYTVGGVEATKLVYDPSDESLVRSLQFLPEDSDYDTVEFGAPTAAVVSSRPEEPFHSVHDEQAFEIRESGAEALDSAIRGGQPDPRLEPPGAPAFATVTDVAESFAVQQHLMPRSYVFLMATVLAASLASF